MSHSTPCEASPTPVEAFVDAFAAGWALGGGATPFLDHFLPAWIDPDVVLVQPLSEPAHGEAGFRAFAERTFAALPDLRAEVTQWWPTLDGVEIDMRFIGTLAGRPVTFVGHDSITLRGGRLLRRHAHLDLRPILTIAASHPTAAVVMAQLLLAGAPAAGLDRALLAMALGRVVLGIGSRVAPGATTGAFGASNRRTPELDYVTRVFGIRAIALGAGYLTSNGAARRRWQRLAFLCDISDTVAGLSDLRRRGMDRSTAIRASVMTGAYALIGAAKVASDLRHHPSALPRPYVQPADASGVQTTVLRSWPPRVQPEPAMRGGPSDGIDR